jgi:hypothetical protein
MRTLMRLCAVAVLGVVAVGSAGCQVDWTSSGSVVVSRGPSRGAPAAYEPVYEPCPPPAVLVVPCPRPVVVRPCPSPVVIAERGRHDTRGVRFGRYVR